MTNKQISDDNSQILITQSTFYNLNIYNNVTSLAIYNGSQVMKELKGGLESVYY